mmetsp:Transcript_52588/g.122387  ORF Transcript_52588/g.122387 Transcript_52588/m.122387 type:complete len:1087 (+) Transcript_52588:46-3306(+)
MSAQEPAHKEEEGNCPSGWSVEELVRFTGTNAEKGLSSSRAAEKLRQDGPNELEKPARPSFLMLFVVQLCGFIIVLLIIAALASVVVNATSPKKEDPLSYTTAIAIFVIVILNAGIAAYTENQAGGALEALAKMSQPMIKVIRDGKEQTIDTAAVVRGDIVLIETGDVVPADIRLIEAVDVKVAEMCLTGEPDDVTKTAKVKQHNSGGGDSEKLTPENMCFSSCSCTSGKGKGVVVATGMQTRIGKIASLMGGGSKAKKRFGCLPDTSANQTPLQQNVGRLGAHIGIGAIAVCIVVFIIGGVIVKTRDPDNPQNPPWLYMILISVTLAVAAIPEGIPLCVTISLSIGSSSMVKKNVLVRKLAAVETLGSASVICSDKTGTLTEGKMTMVHMWSGGVKYNVSGKGFDPTVGTITRAGKIDASKDLGVRSSLLAGVLCCNTTLSQVTDKDTGEQKWEPKGNSSEAPIVVAAHKVDFSTDVVNQEYKRVIEVPFSSSRKMMLTVTDVQGRYALCEGGLPLPSGTRYLAVCKGAPNYILDLCNEWVTETGAVEPLPAPKKEEILNVIDDYSSQALRVLAIAVHPMSSLPFDPASEEVSAEAKFQHCRKDLQFVGLVASIDPERDGVKDSVALAHGASIHVVMITGDYLKTAIAIAKNVGILKQDDSEACAVDCSRLRPTGEYLSNAEIDAITPQVKCFARAKPEDKIEIVKSFQRQGLVSAMTGDGVNDAPALHQADIGVAMGIQGTEVAKGAAEMILTDDNFCSIVSAVEKGRTIYAGIQKFVAFIMSVHIAEVLQIFVCVVSDIPVMRTPLQILFLILVTDLPPSIALGMEPGDKSILEMRPRPKKEPIMIGWMWQSSIMNGTILTGVIVAVYIASLVHYCEGRIFQPDIMLLDDSEPKLANARTVAFISLVFSENIRAYIARSFDRPFYRNFLGNVEMQKAILAAQVALYVAVLVPGFSSMILGLRGLDIGWWGWVVALTGPAGTTLLCELYKVVTYYQVQRYQEKLRKEQEAEAERHQQEARRQAASKRPGEKVSGLSPKDVTIEIKPKATLDSGTVEDKRERPVKPTRTQAVCCPFLASVRMAMH